MLHEFRSSSLSPQSTIRSLKHVPMIILCETRKETKQQQYVIFRITRVIRFYRRDFSSGYRIFWGSRWRSMWLLLYKSLLLFLVSCLRILEISSEGFALWHCYCSKRSRNFSYKYQFRTSNVSAACKHRIYQMNDGNILAPCSRLLLTYSNIKVCHCPVVEIWFLLWFYSCILVFPVVYFPLSCHHVLLSSIFLCLCQLMCLVLVLLPSSYPLASLNLCYFSNLCLPCLLWPPACELERKLSYLRMCQFLKCIKRTEEWRGLPEEL